MIRAYDKNYLSKLQNSFASMLDFAVNDLNLSLNIFFNQFLHSSLCVKIDSGDTSTLAGKSGVEMALEVINDFSKKDYYRPAANKSPEYWTGWALSYFQWYTSLSFKQINSFIPIDEVREMYSPYHEMDITHFVIHMTEIYNQRKSDTNLKSFRQKAALSQSELAEISGIPVRTIQQYEQKQKDINSAKVQTLVILAKVLSCRIEDLIEL